MTSNLLEWLYNVPRYNSNHHHHKNDNVRYMRYIMRDTRTVWEVNHLITLGIIISWIWLGRCIRYRRMTIEVLTLPGTPPMELDKKFTFPEFILKEMQLHSKAIASLFYIEKSLSKPWNWNSRNLLRTAANDSATSSSWGNENWGNNYFHTFWNSQASYIIVSRQSYCNRLIKSLKPLFSPEIHLKIQFLLQERAPETHFSSKRSP